MTRTQKALLVAAALILLLAFLWLRSCSDAREHRRDAELQTRARDADAAAAGERAEDRASIENDTQEITNALAPLPDVPLTDRQRARACAVWMRQHPGDHSTGC